MTFQLQLTLENQGATPLETTIYKGTVFEVLDPMMRVQNLVAAEDVMVVIAEGQTEVVNVPTWCMNEHFMSPANTPMQLTSLMFEVDYQSQYDLWNDLASRN